MVREGEDQISSEASTQEKGQKGQKLLTEKKTDRIYLSPLTKLPTRAFPWLPVHSLSPGHTGRCAGLREAGIYSWYRTEHGRPAGATASRFSSVWVPALRGRQNSDGIFIGWVLEGEQTQMHPRCSGKLALLHRSFFAIFQTWFGFQARGGRGRRGMGVREESPLLGWGS